MQQHAQNKVNPLDSTVRHEPTNERRRLFSAINARRQIPQRGEQNDTRPGLTTSQLVPRLYDGMMS